MDCSKDDSVQCQVGLLQAGTTVPEDIQILVLRALAVQLADRTRHGNIVTNLSSGGQSGLLARLLDTSVANITAVPSRCSVREDLLFSSCP